MLCAQQPAARVRSCGLARSFKASSLAKGAGLTTAAWVARYSVQGVRLRHFCTAFHFQDVLRCKLGSVCEHRSQNEPSKHLCVERKEEGIPALVGGNP